MRFQDIPGQQAIKEKLIRTVTDQRVSHAQLFYGPESSAKLALAIAYAQYINCKNRLKLPATPESNDFATSPPRYLATDSFATSLPRYLATSLLHYLATLLPRYLNYVLPRRPHDSPFSNYPADQFSRGYIKSRIES